MDDILLRVHVVTWNMNSRLPQESFPGGLLMAWKKEKNRERCVYAVGLQEGTQVGLWLDLVKLELGSAFVLVGEGNIGGIHLAIFVTNDILQDFDFDIATDIVSCGIGNIYWNKGAVGFLVRIQSLKLLFVNSHLAAQQDKVKERNQDYRRITSELFKEKNSPGTVPSIENLADVIFWCGDLNYRIEGNRKSVDYLLRKRMMNVLLSNDQLLSERANKRAFVDYMEGGINFLPTYKFDNNTDKYDSSSKQRVPSWTDRVLWKVCKKAGETHDLDVALWMYDSVRERKSSDHKPVIAIFDVHSAPPAKAAKASVGNGSKSLDAVLGQSMRANGASAEALTASAKEEDPRGELQLVEAIVEASKRPEVEETSGDEDEEGAERKALATQSDSNQQQEEEKEEDENDKEIEVAKEALKEPIPVTIDKTSILEASAAVNDLFDAFEYKVKTALYLYDMNHAKRAGAILEKFDSIKSSVDKLRKANKANKVNGTEPPKEKTEEKKVEAPVRVEVEVQANVGEDSDTVSALYQKVSELRTEVYQEKRTHMQTKAKLEIMSRKLNKKNEDDSLGGGGVIVRRRSSVTSIASAKVMQARMRKKQSQIYG